MGTKLYLTSTLIIFEIWCYDMLHSLAKNAGELYQRSNVSPILKVGQSTGSPTVVSGDILNKLSVNK